MPSPTFGIADASTAFESYYASSAFTTLKRGMDANGRPLDYVRFAVSYDTLGSYDTAGSCTWSYDFLHHGGGGAGSAWAALVTELQDATSAGLTPEIVIVGPTVDGQGGGSIDGVTFDPLPITPEPAYGSTGSLFAGWTSAGYEYSCGLEYLVYYLSEDASADHYNAVSGLEAWNEPNGSTQSNSNGGGYNEALPNACETNPNTSTDPTSPAMWNECSGTTNSSTGASYNAGGGLCGSTSVTWCGALEAAYLWALTTNWEQYWKGHVSGFVGQEQAALTLSKAENTGWFNSYWTAINGMGGCLSGYYCFGWYPGIWAVHDYNDPTSAVSNAGNDINAFTSALYGKMPGREQVWITESALDLTSTTGSDDNRSAGCSSLESDDNDTFAGCVDGQPYNQLVGADSFLNLAAHSADGIPVTQILWYEFQPPNADTGWDSGLLAPPQPASGTWSQVAPDGVYGSSSSSTGLRESYCVLAGLPAVDCSATDGYHWSIQPRSVTGNLTKGSETVTGVTGPQRGLPTYAWVTCSPNGVTTCSGIPASTRVTSAIGTSTWTLSAPATVTGNEDLTASG
ncbi:MAG: hypothetical protein ACLP8S_16695 [Solirubrobacteraceae bacterium]